MRQKSEELSWMMVGAITVGTEKGVRESSTDLRR